MASNQPAPTFHLALTTVPRRMAWSGFQVPLLTSAACPSLPSIVTLVSRTRTSATGRARFFCLGRVGVLAAPPPGGLVDGFRYLRERRGG